MMTTLSNKTKRKDWSWRVSGGTWERGSRSALCCQLVLFLYGEIFAAMFFFVCVFVAVKTNLYFYCSCYICCLAVNALIDNNKTSSVRSAVTVSCVSLCVCACVAQPSVKIGSITKKRTSCRLPACPSRSTFDKLPTFALFLTSIFFLFLFCALRLFAPCST